ncbi:hypothetical protein FHX81_7730 [Saccharothrix saharensis]|uniref:DUF6875 domain-containing protein n=1 Tax=Saccharothrix saharensis TaxID=571190 RepID=A0A543JQX5_9PSEU|nr:hypothetical protein [Saccharothrix saharensis]TQM85252.1 hypothetical protein FHX81_7730 [Saccharothrix saharensis]
MIVDPVDPNRFLVELSDLRGPLPEQVRRHQHALYSVVGWAHQYLARPHPDLGRKGPVCPFVQGTLDKGLLYLAVQPGRPRSAAEVTDALARYRAWYLELREHAGPAAQFLTVLVLFPDLPLRDASRLVDETQSRLKADYVAQGLMIGEFHDGPPPKPGLWNPDFRPLRSPVPLLAIRSLVPTDFPFLRDDRDFVAAYLDRVDPGDVPPRWRDEVIEVAAHFGLVPVPPALDASIG